MIEHTVGNRSAKATLFIRLINSDGSDFPTEWKDTPQGRMALKLIDEDVVNPGDILPIAIDKSLTVLFACVSFRRAAKKEWFEAAMMEAVNHAFIYEHEVATIPRPTEDAQLLSLEQIWGDDRVPTTLEIRSPL